jgi:hypothetical protein
MQWPLPMAAVPARLRYLGEFSVTEAAPRKLVAKLVANTVICAPHLSLKPPLLRRTNPISCQTIGKVDPQSQLSVELAIPAGRRRVHRGERWRTRRSATEAAKTKTMSPNSKDDSRTLTSWVPEFIDDDKAAWV